MNSRASVVAAVGISGWTAWSRPLAFGTRPIDAVLAGPALFAGHGGAETSAAVLTVVLSVLTIGVLLRHDQRVVRTP
jgi:hypothetical protein